MVQDNSHHQRDTNIAVPSVLNDVVHLLPITVLVLFFIWYARFQWRMRRVYQLAYKIPGPISFPIIGNALPFMTTSTEELYNKIMTFFDTNPEVFKIWLGYRLLVCISKPEHYEIILNHPKCLEKDPKYRFLKDFVGNGLLASPVNIWKKNRKLINPAFNQKILDSFVQIFNDTSKTLLGNLKREDTDIFPLISACNLDGVCETAMGVKVNAQTTLNPFGKLLDSIMAIMFMRILNIFYDSDFIFKCSKYYDNFYRDCKTLKEFTESIVVAKKKEFLEKIETLKKGEIIEDEKKMLTFLDLLLHLSYKGKLLTDVELRDEVNTFVAAGSDTTAATTCFALLSLGIHQEIQQKVYEEIMDILIDDRDITHEDLPHFSYLERVLKETMRLFPAGSMVLRTCSTEIELADFVIPAHSTLVMPYIFTQRSSRYWKEPLKFDPDRFLPEEINKRHPYSFLPFSGGPRGCIGSKFAMNALKTFLSNIVRTYKVKCEYKSIEEVKLKMNLLLRPTDGFKVSFELRK